MGSIRIGEWFQGPTGSGQGGWAASHLERMIGEPATVAIKAPIPLETDLGLVEDAEGRWLLVDGRGREPDVVLVAERWDPDFATTSPVSLADAEAARGNFPVEPRDHPVPFCFSCGLQADSMHVHAGPLGDGRYATDWLVPGWAVDGEGEVEVGAIWAALDCTAAWYACYEGGARRAFTVQLATETLSPLAPGGRYSLVGWCGDYDPGWDGRKRGAASAAFDADGNCIARSRSFWVAVD